jgi:PAS domain S-box-containing protein
MTDDLSGLFAVLLDSVPVGVAVFDRDTRIKYINARQAKLNNLSVAEHIGKTTFEFLPQAADVVQPKLRFVLETGVPLLNQEIKGSRPSSDGHHLHRLASYFPWRSSDGEIKGVLAIILDSQVDDLSQQLIENSQHRLLQVLDNLFAFVGVMELDGTLTHANRAPLDAAGLTLNDVVGKKMWDCFWFAYDRQLQLWLQEVTHRCCGGEVIRQDIQVRMLNDELMWIDFMLAPLRDKDGQVTHLIPSAMDISQRHESEVALKQSEERYLSVFESSDDAIITKSLDGLITGWNPAATHILGYSAAEAVGRPITMLFPEEKLQEETKIMQKIKEGHRVPSFETVRIHKNGRRLEIAVTLSPLRDRSGTVVGACKIARDISVQRHQLNLIEQALEEKTALLHEVHHRVKNNLQIVSSLMSLQARKAPPATAQALIECQARIRAMALVHQLLYESSSVADVDLSDYIARLVVLTKGTYDSPDSGVQLFFSNAGERVSLDIHRTIPCGLVINELISNALKHAFTGHADGQSRIDVKMRLDQAGKLHLSVCDNGAGLPADFAWGRTAGLGSQLIPMFVNQLHGELHTESSATGSCFTIALNPGKQEPVDEK